MTTNDGGPAFPNVPSDPQYADWDKGMTLRDWFAGQALAGCNANEKTAFSFHWVNAKGDVKLLGYGETPAGKDEEGWRIAKTPLQAKCESMYAQADAMLAARGGAK